MPRGTQVKRDGLVITVERRGISSGIAFRHLSHHWLHVQSAKDHTGEETTLSGVAIRSQVPGGPHTSPNPNNTWGTPGINNCAGPISQFLLDTRANFSVLTEAPGPLSSRSTTIMGLSGWAKYYYFSHPLSCNWDSVLFSHNCLFVLESPSPLLGRDILNKVQASVFHEYGTRSFSPTNGTKCKS